MLRYLCYAALLGVVGAMIYDLSNDPRDMLTAVNAERIAQERMNQADVIALLGPPKTIDGGAVQDFTVAAWFSSHDTKCGISVLFRTGNGDLVSITPIGELPKISKRKPKMLPPYIRTPQAEAYRQRVVGRKQTFDRMAALGVPLPEVSVVPNLVE